MFPYSEALKSVLPLRMIQSDCTGIRLVRLRGLFSAIQQSLYHGFNRGAISHIAGANKPDKLGLFRFFHLIFRVDHPIC